ncbi:prosaposin-like [Orbicella faveolata]|uniref:prosaposin-like n=1 Tax=Orbicella faveolata TaxID=48498 RepID=UPI0009E5B737|nr:prosaposin-like [Orbicella faveolata]
MSLTVVALVLFVATVSGTPTGQAKCSWGPSYWCQNYKQALECNALEHCRANVWAVKDEEACNICQQVVPMIRDFLAKNTTQAEVVTLAEQACEDIAGPLAPMCKSVIDKYEPVIWDSVLELMADPKQVCTALGLCDSKKSKKVDAKLVTRALPLKNHLKTILAPVLVAAKPKATVIKSKPFKTSAECILCEFVMKELDSILQENATQQEIEEALDEVCSLLPDTVKTECEQFVDQYAPAIIAILSQELDPSVVCTTLGLCDSNKHSKVMEKTVTFVPGSNQTCQICEAVMTYVKNLLADNATQQEILSLLKEGCSLLPSQLSAECNAIVSEYGPAILDLIAESDPHTLCEQIGLCTSALKKEEFCFLGASYWCANKRNAINCNALKHCTDHVWN